MTRPPDSTANGKYRVISVDPPSEQLPINSTVTITGIASGIDFRIPISLSRTDKSGDK